MAYTAFTLNADIIDSTDTVVDTVTIGQVLGGSSGRWRVDEFEYEVDTSGFGGTPPYYFQVQIDVLSKVSGLDLSFDSVENPLALAQKQYGGTSKVGLVPGVSSSSGKFLKDDGTWDTPGGLIAYKTADENVSSSTTFQDDNHITGISLDADSLYAIEGYLDLTTPNAADFKMQLVFSQTPQEFRWSALAFGSNLDDDDEGTGALSFLQSDHALGGSVTIRGFVYTNASNGGTVKLQWAQLVSDATNTTLGKGSHLKFQRLS